MFVRSLCLASMLVLAHVPVVRADDTDESRDATKTTADTPPEQESDKHKAKDAVYDYKPGRWLTFKLPHKTHLKFRLILEPMFRYSHRIPPNGVLTDDSVDMFIRRGRAGFQVDAPNDLGFRFEISVKNMHFEIHNMFAYWKPRWNMELQFGFIKAPGGLERDTFSFDEEFIERSVITFYNRDHEVGAKLEGTNCDKTLRYAAAITRDPPPLPGGDPEDTPQVPTGVEEEDIARAASKWAAEGRVAYVPSKAFEVSVNVGTRLRMDEPDFGEIAVEPYDSTFLTNRPYRGVFLRASADVGISQPHWKLTAEAAFRRDGKQLAYPDGTFASEMTLDGHLTAEAAYLIFGWTPNGEWGPAYDAAPLKKGWALVTRLMAERIKPVDQPAATFGSVEVAWHYEVNKHLRVQLDAAVQKFGKYDFTLLNENLDMIRLYGEAWAELRL